MDFNNRLEEPNDWSRKGHISQYNSRINDVHDLIIESEKPANDNRVKPIYDLILARMNDIFKYIPCYSPIHADLRLDFLIDLYDLLEYKTNKLYLYDVHGYYEGFAEQLEIVVDQIDVLNDSYLI